STSTSSARRRCSTPTATASPTAWATPPPPRAPATGPSTCARRPAAPRCPRRGRRSGRGTRRLDLCETLAKVVLERRRVADIVLGGIVRGRAQGTHERQARAHHTSALREITAPPEANDSGPRTDRRRE